MLRHLAISALAAGLALACLAPVAPLHAADRLQSSVDAANVPEDRRTKAGLYLTPSDAFKAAETRRDVLFIDIRDPAEFQFVGFPTVTDRNIPYRVVNQDLALDGSGKHLAFEPNVDFPKAVELLLKERGLGKDAHLILQCRSGTRSAFAVDYLYDLGYRNVWSQVEGMEGDLDEKSGHRTVNGWKNAGMPWTYDLSEMVVYKSPTM